MKVWKLDEFDRAARYGLCPVHGCPLALWEEFDSCGWVIGIGCPVHEGSGFGINVCRSAVSHRPGCTSIASPPCDCDA
jgi:hypothetical protein